MNAQAHITLTPRDRAVALIEESRAFLVGSADWKWRRAAAWKLDQMHRKVPACDWTDAPLHGFTTQQERQQ